MFRLNRRRWLTTAATATGAAALGWTWHRHRQQTIRIGLIGCGMRGSQLAALIQKSMWYDVQGQLVSICDADQTRANAVRVKFSPAAETTQDFRQTLAREDIDAVFIATPDHWHAAIAIEALRAGKHVYCEKPMTLTIDEGRQLISAAQSSDRTFQVGTQQRSHPYFQQACELVRNGRLGQVKRIEVSVPINRGGGPFATQPAPASLDWDRWLGPAPLADYCPERFTGFRFWYEYGGGTMADWGAHHIDIAHWAMGLENSGPVEISGAAELPQIENGFNTPLEFAVEMKYAGDLTITVKSHPHESGVLFQGDQGRIYASRKRLTGKPVENLASDPLPSDAVRFGYPRKSMFADYNTSHLLHFFDCVLTGRKPVSDVISQHRSASACHLANIAVRLGRTVRWDPAREQFDQDPQATAMLSRPSRLSGPRIASRGLQPPER